MEIEIQGIPQSIRPSYQNRIKTSKSELQRYKKLSKDLHAQLSRADLLGSRAAAGGPTSDDPYGSNDDRTRLLAGTALLEDGTRRLQESQRIALETEEQGADILRSLRGQREQIQNARDTVSFFLWSFVRVLCCVVDIRGPGFCGCVFICLYPLCVCVCGAVVATRRWVDRQGLWDTEEDDPTVRVTSGILT